MLVHKLLSDYINYHQYDMIESHNCKTFQLILTLEINCQMPGIYYRKPSYFYIIIKLMQAYNAG